jgi:hypothetical protein
MPLTISASANNFTKETSFKPSDSYHRTRKKRKRGLNLLVIITKYKNASSSYITKHKMSSFATPLKLGPLLLKNRVIMASLTRDRNLVPGPLQVEYYTQRAGAGLNLTEGTLIEQLGSEWSNARQYFVLRI